MKTSPFHLLMNPQSIATVGAGNNPMKMGTIQALSIVQDGFKGPFYPIHPRDSEVFGYKAYQSAFDLPEAPDLVMFVLPAPLVVKILDDFGSIGTKRAIIITAGFRETGPGGEELEKLLKEVARKHGIRFVGPNCMGVINSSLPLNVTVAPISPQPGPLGMVSQSGTYITQTLPYLNRRGIRFSKAISVGNEADLDLTDALEYLGEDEKTKAIALYIEGIRDGGKFIKAARKITPHKPIVAQYVGGSVAGARAGSSHTGAMAGPDFIYDGLFRQCGILRVDTVEELYNQSWVLANQPPLRGRRIGVLTNSGGPGTAMAHICNEGGLDVPPFSGKLHDSIKKVIPPHGSAANPVDLTFHMDAEVLSTTLPELVMESGEVDGIVMHGLMSSGFLKAIYPHLGPVTGGLSEGELLKRFDRDLSKPVLLPFKNGIPMVISSFFGREDNYTAYYQDSGIPVFDGPEKAARGMLALHRYGKIQKREPYLKPELPPRSEEASAIIAEAVAKGQEALDEYSSKAVLQAYGVPLGEEKLVFTLEEALSAADSIGYPLVLKGCSPEITHKTGTGLVQLAINNSHAFEKAYSKVIEAAGKDIPVLVAKMIHGDREVMAGMARYPGFGPSVLFGLGGIFAEALEDRVFRIAPLSPADAVEMISGINAAALLGEYRGLPAVNQRALGSILQAVSSAALLHPEIAEIDLNPIIIRDREPVAVDALIVLDRPG